MECSLRGVTNANIYTVRSFVRDHIPAGQHFIVTEMQLRIMALSIMDRLGLLDRDDSIIFNTPLFGEAYVANKGNLPATLLEIGIDLIPGTLLLSYLI